VAEMRHQRRGSNSVAILHHGHVDLCFSAKHVIIALTTQQYFDGEVNMVVGT
jgi:hypothetical protein